MICILPIQTFATYQFLKKNNTFWKTYSLGSFLSVFANSICRPCLQAFIQKTVLEKQIQVVFRNVLKSIEKLNLPGKKIGYRNFSVNKQIRNVPVDENENVPFHQTDTLIFISCFVKFIKHSKEDSTQKSTIKCLKRMEIQKQKSMQNPVKHIR